MSGKPILAGNRSAVMPWPDALVPVGPWYQLTPPPVGILAGAPPVTVHYLQGPVPYIELRHVGSAAVPVRCYLGDTLPIPFDGVLWEARPAFNALDRSLDRPVNDPAAALVQHNCVLLFDVPFDYQTRGDLIQHYVTTHLFSIAGTSEIFNMPFLGVRFMEVQVRASPTWPGTLTAQLNGGPAAVDAAGAMQWLFYTPIGAAINGAGVQRRACAGEVATFNVVAGWDLSLAGMYDRYRLLCLNGGTAGTDTLSIEVRGMRHFR